MKKCFNNVQMFKSSEDCGKFSKSVSYETLVGGTTTTGREIKQTRRLFLSSAVKPLSAVGTLTSLLCNSAKVMEKLFYCHSEPKDTFYRHPERSEGSIKTETVMPDLIGHLSRIKKEAAEFLGSRLLSCPRMTGKALSFLRLRGASGAQGISAPASCRKAHKRRFLFNSWILRFVCTPLRMTIPVLSLIFTLFATAESRADDVIPTSGTCNSAGTCLWSLGSDGTLTISAKNGAEDVKMGDYYCLYNPCDQSTLISRPWEASLQQIKSVVIGDNITRIGNDAFQNASNLTSVIGMKDVKTIGWAGVFAYTGLTSITIQEGVTSIGNDAFQNARNLTSITIPEGVTYIGAYAFAYTGLTSITIPDNIDTASWNAEVFRNLPEDTDIVCQGDLNKCYENLAKYFAEETCPQNLIDADKGNLCSCSDSKYCISPTRVKEATDPLQCTGNYGWSGAGCSRKNADGSVPCVSGFVEWDKQCWSEYPFAKKRWTPAEANEWLHDGNDNFVIITFKK